MEVNTVRDDTVARTAALALAEHAEDTRVAVVEGAHSVEKVGNHAGALVGSCNGLLVSSVRVADGVDDVAVCDFGDLVHHLADFWGGGDHFDRA